MLNFIALIAQTELMSHQRQQRSIKLMLPLRCHHNPNCLPISFLIKKLNSCPYTELHMQNISHSWPCSLSRRPKYMSELSPKHVCFNNEGTSRRNRISIGKQLAVIQVDSEAYSSPTLVRCPLVFRMIRNSPVQRA